jgi:hypothetical protein
LEKSRKTIEAVLSHAVPGNELPGSSHQVPDGTSQVSAFPNSFSGKPLIITAFSYIQNARHLVKPEFPQNRQVSARDLRLQFCAVIDEAV